MIARSTGRGRELTRRRLVAKSQADRSTLEAAFGDLESILNRRRAARTTAGAESELLAACRLVGAAMGAEVRAPSRVAHDRINPLEEIAKTSRLALRRVELRGRWYRDAMAYVSWAHVSVQGAKSGASGPPGPRV